MNKILNGIRMMKLLVLLFMFNFYLYFFLFSYFFCFCGSDWFNSLSVFCYLCLMKFKKWSSVIYFSNSSEIKFTGLHILGSKSRYFPSFSSVWLLFHLSFHFLLLLLFLYTNFFFPFTMYLLCFCLGFFF